MTLHAPEHIAHVQQKAGAGPCVIADFDETPDNVTYVTPSSYEDATKVGSPAAQSVCFAFTSPS
jgi:hypothetical protein